MKIADEGIQGNLRASQILLLEGRDRVAQYKDPVDG